MVRPLTPRQRTLRARLAAHTLHSQGKTNTVPAREAFNLRFVNEVDPDRILPAAERARRASQARKAHFTRLALRSARCRSKRATA